MENVLLNSQRKRWRRDQLCAQYLLPTIMAGHRRNARILTSRKEDLWLFVLQREEEFRSSRREGPGQQKLHPHLSYVDAVSHLSSAPHQWIWSSASLRRAVLHPNLVVPTREESVDGTEGNVDVEALIKRFEEGDTSSGDSNAFADQVLANLAVEDDAECPICFDTMDMPVLIPTCMHQWFVSWILFITTGKRNRIWLVVARTVLWLSSNLVERRRKMGSVRRVRRVP